MTAETDVVALKAQIDALDAEIVEQKDTLATAVLDSTTMSAIAAANLAQITALNTAATSAATASDATLSTTLKNAALTAFTGQQIASDGLEAVSAALHRSPNAITAMFIYDVTNDSDGGVWTEKCQGTSWMTEPLCPGKWLGAQVSETAARVGGVVGDYFQLTTDGKFYKLNATTGVTEVFRGNKAKFPKLSAIVAEAGRVTIYDLTEAGRPMWRSFVGSSANYPYWWKANNQDTASCVFALQGCVYFGTVGADQNGLKTIDFVRDFRFAQTHVAPTTGYVVGVATPTSTAITVALLRPTIVNPTVNAVSATILPGAPIDLATGLAVPTVAVGTAGGVSVIKHDGTVQSTSATGSQTSQIDFVGNTVAAIAQNRIRCSWDLLTPLPAGGIGHLNNYWPREFWSGSIPASLENGAAQKLSRLGVSCNLGLTKLKDHPVTQAKGMVAYITNAYNTGWMPGDIRGAWLADTVAETITASGELWPQPGFDAATGLTLDACWSVSGGVAASDGGNGFITVATPPLVIGKTYTATVQVASRVSGAIYAPYVGVNGVTVVSVGVFTYSFVAASANLMIYSDGFSGSIDNVSVKLSTPDRSVKNNGPILNGTLTKTAVASGAALVAYSGFSAANYLRQPYSVNLDIGTGEIYAGTWFKLSATVQGIAASLASAGKLGANVWSFVAASGGSSQVSPDVYRIYSADGSYSTIGGPGNATTAGKIYKIAFNIDSVTIPGNGMTIEGFSAVSVLSVVGPVVLYLASLGGAPAFKRASTALDIQVSGITIQEVTGSLQIASRSFASGPSLSYGINAAGQLTTSMFDGVSTRTVTTPNAYNTSDWAKVEVSYKSGKLAITVNAVEVASTTGTPLLTMNNAGAVLTIGNSYDLDAAFPDSLTLTKMGATVPTAEQALMSYMDELALFKPGAQCNLPSSGTVLDVDYDSATDVLAVSQSAFESKFKGLTRISSVAPSAGTFTGVKTASGVKLSSRVTTNPGVDIEIATYNFKDEFAKKRPQNTLPEQFEFDAIAAQTTFDLPQGYSVSAVMVNGQLQRLGATKDYTIINDGFKDSVLFSVAPGASAYVLIMAIWIK